MDLRKEIKSVQGTWKEWRSKTFDFERPALVNFEAPLSPKEELELLTEHFNTNVKPELEKEIKEAETHSDLFEKADKKYETKKKKLTPAKCILSWVGLVLTVGSLIGLIVAIANDWFLIGVYISGAIGIASLIAYAVLTAKEKALAQVVLKEHEETENHATLAGVYAMYADYISTRTALLKTLIEND